MEAILERRTASRADGLDALAKACEAILDKAEGGDVQAFREIADRLDGKVAQPIGGADDLSPIRQSMTVDFVGSVPRET